MISNLLTKITSSKKYMQIIYAVLFLLFVFDLAFSFHQFRFFAFEGDFATIIIPSDSYKSVMENPLGWQVINHPEGYAQPNRYFEFKIMMEYFKTVPLILQNFFSPIGSMYFSAALLKVFTQFALIYLIAILLSGKMSLFNRKNILIYTLCFPFFQTWGYQELMAIIDPSITYAFCYATSTIFVIVFYIPFVLKYIHKSNFNFNWFWYLIFFLYSIFVNLNASLNAPIILIVSLIAFAGYGIHYAQNNKGNLISNFIIGIFKTIPKPIFYIFIWASIMALYSLYIGTFNLENDWVEMSLQERYSKLPKGVIKQFFGKFGMALFTITIAIQLFIFYRLHPLKQKYSKFIIAAFLFILIYILLLPLGGYRSYRPLILRRDTFIPVLLMLMALFSFLTYQNWSIAKSKHRIASFLWVTGLLMIFTIADKKVIQQNDCEVRNLIQISQSNDPIIELNEDCSVMSWGLINNPVYSNYNMMLLYHYGIIKDVNQRYIHKSTKK